MSGIDAYSIIPRTPQPSASAGTRPSTSTTREGDASPTRETPAGMPGGRSTRTGRTQPPPATRTSADIALQRLDAAEAGEPPPHVRQRAAQQALVAYSDTAGAANAQFQAAVGMGINTATAFGAARTGGEQGVVDLIGHAHAIKELLTRNPADAGQVALGKLAQLGPGWISGAALGGLGSIAGQVVLSPIFTAIAESMTGSKSTLVPVPPEHLVPDPDPADHEDAASLAHAQAQVDARRQRIRERQAGFGIDTARGIGTGTAAFDGLHGIRAGVMEHTDPKPSLGARVGYGTAASGGAGFLTGGALALQKAMATEAVDVDGQVRELPLFQVAKAPRGNVLANIGASVQGAARAFNDGRTGLAALANLGRQLALRTGGIALATLANTALQVGAAAANAALSDDEHATTKKGAVALVAAVLAFTAAVAIWFTLLPMIQSRQAQPRPAPGDA